MTFWNAVVGGFLGGTLTFFLKSVYHGYRESHPRLGSAARTVLDPTESGSAPRAKPAAPSDAGVGASVIPVAQEIVAWRSWILRVEQGAFLDEDFYLTSWNGTRWEGPTLRADQTPTRENEHGVYARPTSWNPRAYLFYPMPVLDIPGVHKVYGQVALSGRVIQGETGWRAEQGTIRSLWVTAYPSSPNAFLLKEILERRYACTVEVEKAPPYEPWIYL